jgi:hypothetical protein
LRGPSKETAWISGDIEPNDAFPPTAANFRTIKDGPPSTQLSISIYRKIMRRRRMLCKMTSRRGVIASVAAAALVPLLATRAQPPYIEISYPSSGLRLQGYFYQPAASGPFPTLTYNHGSRKGRERPSIPWARLASLYVAAGYAVLVPERGCGRSDGSSWSEAVGGDVGRLVDRDEPAGPAPSDPLGVGGKAPSAAVPGLTRVCSSLAANCSIMLGPFWARQSSDRGGATNVQT